MGVVELTVLVCCVGVEPGTVTTGIIGVGTGITGIFGTTGGTAGGTIGLPGIIGLGGGVLGIG
jgi:hypothetical protein